MKVLCDREKLHEALSLAVSFVPAKSPKAVLTNVCLVATTEALELVTTDMDLALRYRIEDGAKVTQPGTAVVPARVFHDFVRDFTGEHVSIESTESNTQLQCGDDTAELVITDADEFPSVARFDEAGSYSLQAGTITALVNKTAFAAAKEQGRYAMHGVLVEVGDGTLKMVATDGRRLALAHAPIDAAARAPQKPAIVPTRALQLFSRVMSDPLDQVKLAFSDNQIGLKSRNAEMFARLIDGEFPRYTAVIPAESRNFCEADSALLERKIKLVSNVTSDEARAVRFELKGGHLGLFAQSAGRGEARANMEVTFKGTDSEIAFNPDFVVEGLRNCETGQVKLEFNERTAPGKFLLGENYVYIVMPITIDT
jgi:DNA polymerase-3 subunit beta